MTEEEYEILPHKLLSDLKYDVEALKKKLSEPDNKANELILEIESMKDSVHELNIVFGKALQDMQEEDLGKTVKQLLDKLTTVVSQNEIIAHGMVAISDKLEGFMHQQSLTKPTSTLHYQTNIPPVKHTMGPPSDVGSRIAPPPPMGNRVMDFPPPPPAGKKRRGLF
ncbi:MAG: hypothetical protein KKH52_02915 [Nanoarchaeota archaeon]|nr:hypothetical protein [Nanoarchaeota archaeon]MBU1622818.1 hypothetical protein [Nanoarchaeota archaeon]MBU1974321.1 hypothetical protein [Nanoarchaeota archaeon]